MRLALTLALTLALVGVVYAVFMITTVQKNSQYAEQTLNKDLAKTLVAERNLVRENALDKQALQALFMAYMNVNPSIEIYLVDLQGKILSYSAEPGRVQRSSVALKPIQTFLQEDAMFPVLGDDPRSSHRQKVFSVTPIPNAEHANGYLYVILRGEQYDEVEQLARDQALLRLSAWVVGIALLISFIVGLLVFYPVTKRLRHLSKQLEDFRESDFTANQSFLTSEASDELSQLEQNIAAMSLQISQQLEQLAAQDTQRRDLFASLSHDLRTPLATLHGYLETLQIKADDLSAEQREAYTTRAIQFSNRLKTLVDELFEMAKLDTLDVAANMEPFSLPELVQDVLQQFQLPAQKAGLTLHVEGDTELPFVAGDIGLMQRVFENLLGNALCHVYQGDEITIVLRNLGDRVQVDVRDTGCGIAAEHLQQIFEPLYQINNAHRGGEHAGLGLAIVQRIVALHQSQITVSSALGDGTTFTFSLLFTPNHF